MSVGHQIPSGEEGVLPAGLRALITPEIVAEVRRRVRRAVIVRRDVPLVAGASNDNERVYIDRRVGDEYLARALYDVHEMIPFAPADTLPWHELGEQYFEEELGLGYLSGAHPIGDWFERQHVEQDLGIEWDSYQEVFEHLIPICRAHKPVDFPHDIRMQPYIEGGDPELLAEVLRAQGKHIDAAEAEAEATPKDGLQGKTKHALLKASATRTRPGVRTVQAGEGKDQAMTDFKLYLPFDLAKVDKTQQMVWGYASTPTLDLDNEIVKLEAIEEALPDYMEWRNIREMHRPSAVGVTKEATVKSEGLYIGAKIVDKDAWEKCVEGVYKGFSIGGRTLAKVENEITKLQLTEISLVDRPANPDCRIDVVKVAKAPEPETAEPIVLDDKEKTFVGTLLEKLFGKREFSDKERKHDAETGAAMPHGGYPIENEGDLHDAIQAFGRAKDKGKTKAHIKSRAAALGLESKLPDDWKSAGDGDIEKNMMPAMMLAAAFENVRQAQRALCQEENAERDGTDLALARKLGHIAQEIALAMGEKASHEGMEAIDLSDADDKYLPTFDEDGVLEMAASPEELRKRMAASHKAAITKAGHHLDKAMACQKSGMNSQAAALRMCKSIDAEDLTKLFEAAGIEKASAASLVGHLHKAHGHFSDASDHQDVAKSNIAKASHAWSSAGIQEDWGGEHDELPTNPGGSIHEPGQPTEGHVPLIEGDEVYPGKAARRPASNSISKAEHEALLAAAVAKAEAEGLKRQIEVMSKAPAGSPRARAFAIGRDAFPVGDVNAVEDAMSKRMRGIDAFDLENPEDRQRASAKMIANQIADTFNGGRTFARSVHDPAFRGGAAGGR